MAERENLIYALYDSFNSKEGGNAEEKDKDPYNSVFDSGTGTMYCGENTQIIFNMPDECKRYIASRYFDYVNKKTDSYGRVLTPPELQKNKYKAEALKELMNKFNIEEIKKVHG